MGRGQPVGNSDLLGVGREFSLDISVCQNWYQLMPTRCHARCPRSLRSACRGGPGTKKIDVQSRSGTLCNKATTQHNDDDDDDDDCPTDSGGEVTTSRRRRRRPATTTTTAPPIPGARLQRLAGDDEQRRRRATMTTTSHDDDEPDSHSFYWESEQPLRFMKNVTTH